MAFVANNLTVMDAAGLGTVSTFAVFKYTSNDLLSTIDASGYFNTAYKQFHLGDLIIVSADVDGTPVANMLIVTSATAATTVTTTPISTATLTFNTLYSVTATVAAIGTASTTYVAVNQNCSVTRIDGVGDANGSTATATITVAKNGSTTIGTITFLSSYTAGSVRSNTSPVSVSLSAGDVISLATDGGGDSTAVVRVTLQLTPA